MASDIDIFQPVQVDLIIQEQINTPLAVNNVALMTTNTTALPVGTLKQYSTASAVGTDFGLTSAEYLFASQFFANNQQLSFLIMVSFDNTSPSSGYLANAVIAGYNKSIVNGWGGFAGIAWAEVSPLTVTTPDDTLTELNALALFAKNNNITFVTIAMIDNEAVFNQTSGNVLQLIKNQQYNNSLFVVVNGMVNFTSDPSMSNKRSDASVFGILSSASQNTLGSLAIYGQQFVGLTPIPVGETDEEYSITWTTDFVNGLVNNQLNLYVQYGPKILFALGMAANIAQNIECKTVYIKLFLSNYIQQQLDSYFEPATLKYDDSGLSAVFGVLNVILKQMAADQIIESMFSVTPPALNYTTPPPRILGPFVINCSIGSTVYGVTINGTISV